MLHKFYSLNNNFKKYFNNYDFHNLYKELLNFCTVDLSAFYFDIRKDTLYCDKLDDPKRKSTILFLNIILNSLLDGLLQFCLLQLRKFINYYLKMEKSIHLEKF